MDIKADEYLRKFSVSQKEMHEFQSLGKELQDHFTNTRPSQIWGLFYKEEFSVPLIRDSWIAYQKWLKIGGTNSFKYFMGILRNKAGLKVNKANK